MVNATVMFEDPTAVTATRSHLSAVRYKDCDSIEYLNTARSSAEPLCLLTEDRSSTRRCNHVAAMELENLIVLLMVQGSERCLEMGQVERVSFPRRHSEEKRLNDDAGSAREVSCSEQAQAFALNDDDFEERLCIIRQ